MQRFLIAIACALVAGAAAPHAWGEDPPPPATTVVSEPVTIPTSPQPTPDPAPDPAPPAAALQPPELAEPVSPPTPVATPPDPQAAVAAVSAQSKPKPKNQATPKKKPKTKHQAKAPPDRTHRPAEEPLPPNGEGSVPAGDASSPPLLELPAPTSGHLLTDLGESLGSDGGGTSAVLSTALFGLLGLAVVLFGLAAVPTGALGDALVAVLVATRRVELAAGGALTLTASAMILAVISLGS